MNVCTNMLICKYIYVQNFYIKRPKYIFTFLIKYIECIKQLHHRPPSTGSGGPIVLPPG